MVLLRVFCFAQSVKRIQSFARLADNNGKRVLVNYRIVITELRSENRFNGNAQSSTHEITGNKADMVSRTAADDLNRIHLFSISAVICLKPSSILPFEMRGAIVFAMASGCSMISLIIKCGYPHFSAALASQSMCS